MSRSLPGEEKLLARLNRDSLNRSFVPQLDIDWDAPTSDAEFESLYPFWSLLRGTGLDGPLGVQDRITFVKYQQINLMTFTALLERYGIDMLTRLYSANASTAFAEYVGHFIKEEVYHHTMFKLAVEKIQSTMPHCQRLPTRGLDRTFRWLFRWLGALPGEKLRMSVAFMLFRYAEQVTIYAYHVVRKAIPCGKGLISQVWALHALDESRHLAFDQMILERCQIRGPLASLPVLLALACCTVLSLWVNANEIWALRQLGLPVHFWQLPHLMRKTEAPFKRRVFSLLTQTLRGRQPRRYEP